MEARKLNFIHYKDCIDFFYKNRKTEYVIKGGISPHSALLELQDMVTASKPYPNSKFAKVIIKHEAVQRFHPNIIDNKEFWTYAKQKFPKFSVCGGKSKNIKECNKLTLNMSKESGFLNFLEYLISKSSPKIDFFEIGYGHGNIFFELKDKVNYLGIDYYKIKTLNKYKQLMTIDKSGIPDSIKPNSQDIVYSVNVLQHCSQNDRFQYLEEGYDKLRCNGLFFGSCLIQCKENENLEIWGMEDIFGRRYCNFFNQLTEVDKLVEFTEKIGKLKFKLLDYKMVGGNNFFFVLQK